MNSLIRPLKFGFVLLLLSTCSPRNAKDSLANIQYSYLALGDSYTIGESVSEKDRWPVQLSDSLSSIGFKVSPPTIVATTGWTTAELKDGIKKAELNSSYDLVSLLIGVNNQYRGYDLDIYKVEFRELVEQAIAFANGDSTRVFVVSIPNYGVTPFGIQKGEEKIRTELLEYDAIAEQISSEYGIPFVNITPISENAKTNPDLIADDQLYPSGKMYTKWTSEIIPVATSLLDEQ